MTTSDRSITEQLPDLPGLESAEGGSGHVWLIAVTMLGILFLIVGGILWFVWKYGAYLGDQLPLMYGIAVTMAITSVWVTVRLLSGDYHWQTTPDGLTTQSIMRRRSARWDDVQQASSRRSSLSSLPAYTIRALMGKFDIRPMNTYGVLGLYASMWQHLRRVGKADSLVLPDEAFSIWDRIPDELPREMDWTNPHPAAVWPYIVLPAVFMAGGLWLAIPEAIQGHYFFPALMLPAVSILWFMFGSVVKEILLSARQVSLHEDRLEAVTSRGPVMIPWNEVVSGKWDSDASSGCLRLVIGGGSPRREVGILYKPSSQESSKLILAIIRRLRTAGTPQALPIPDLLHSDLIAGAVNQASPQTGPVILRLTWTERLAVGFFPGVPIVTLISLFCADKPNPNPWQIIVPCIAAYVMGFILSGSYSVCADADRVSKRFMFWRKTVFWRMVAGYTIWKLRPTSTITKHLISDHSGKVLMNIAANVASKSDQQRFLAYVHARLAEVLPQEALNPPWKARPWTPE